MRSWRRFGELELASGELSLSDTSFFFDLPFIARVVPGRYVVSVDPSPDDRSDRAVRVLRKEESLFRPGRIHRGALKMSFGQLGICDRSIAASLFPIQSYHELLDGAKRPRSELRTRSGEVMLITYPVIANATFSVVELMKASGQCVGIEIDLTDWFDDAPGSDDD